MADFTDSAVHSRRRTITYWVATIALAYSDNAVYQALRFFFIASLLYCCDYFFVR